jgi:hypothetical protein
MAGTDRRGMIEAVQGLLEELCSPDLTLGRANVLRPRLVELLEALASPDGAGGKDATSRPREGRETLPAEFTAFPSLLQGPCVG